MEYRDLKKQLKSEEQIADIQKLLHLRHREKMVRMEKLIKEQKELSRELQKNATEMQSILEEYQKIEEDMMRKINHIKENEKKESRRFGKEEMFIRENGKVWGDTSVEEAQTEDQSTREL